MKRYKTIVADPPWDYGGALTNSKSIIGSGKTRNQEYNGQMSIGEIKQFDLVRQLADDDCIVFLWTVNRFLYECPYILDAWGFDVGECGKTMVWNKLGGCVKLHTSWFSNAEFVLVGKKGNISWKSTKGLRACFDAKNEGDSIKPSAFYRMIRNSTFAPRIDLFARRRHLGFDAWGNQVEPHPPDDLVTTYPKVKVSKLGTGELHQDEI